MRKMTKLLALIALVTIVAATSCNRGQEAASGRDLQGMHIVIGNWWGNYNVNDVVPSNENEERTLEWRKRIQAENNFTMEERHIAGWGEMAQLAATSIMSGAPAANVIIVQPDWAMALIRQGLAYPITDNTAVDLRNPQPAQPGLMAPEWNQKLLEAFTIGGKGYAIATGPTMGGVPMVFFNKRLFREAGIDPDLPYDMQRDGTWTWEAFVELSRRLTRDVNNDGIIDTYAMPEDFSVSILEATISSNGANYVDRDSSGRFVNATGRPEFLEALQFAIRLKREGVMKPKPDGVNWDWFKSEFIDGNVAMRIEESYIWNELRSMRDDWGVVFFPRGPRATSGHIMYTHENVMVIPATHTPEQVYNIMYALSLWVTPINTDWKSGYWHIFRDSRAVDETVALMRDPSIARMRYQILVPGINTGEIAWVMWHHDGEPAQLVERVAPNWNVLIDELNSDLFK